MRERQEPAPDKPVGGKRKRKDTKRWCKGIVGREHQPEIVLAHWVGGKGCEPKRGFYTSSWFYGDGPWVCRHQEVCGVCRKVLQFLLDPARCPDRPKDV